MNIVFEKIKIHNFMSFGDAETTFDDRGYTLITGINNNIEDCAKSNGAGKSTMFNALCWALTGETISGVSKNISNNVLDDGCFVELCFSVDNNKYKIIRSKDSKEYKTNLFLYVNGENRSGKGIRDTEKILSEYLPDIDSSLIGSVIILGQGLPHRFTNNTPSARKEILEKLSKSDFMIEDLKQRIANRKSELQKKLRENEDSLLENKSKISVFEKELENNKTKLNSLCDVEFLDTQISSCESEVEGINSRLNESTKNVNKLNESVNSFRSKYIELNSKKQENILNVSSEIDKKLNELNCKKVELTTTIRSLKNEISKIESINDVCPTCGQKLPNVTKPNATKQKEELEALNSELNEIEHNIESINIDKDKKVCAINEMFSNDLISLEKEGKLEKEKLDYATSENNSLNQEYKLKYNKLCELKSQKETYYATKKSIEDTIRNNEKSMEICNNNIHEFTKSIELINKHLSLISSFSTIVTRDFRGFLLSSIIEYIGKKAKEYSVDVFGTDKVDFYLDGNNIFIGYCSKPYENLSGGEKQKVDIIVQFALRDMLCNMLDFSSNIIVVDEIFDNLDSNGCSKILNLIGSKLQDISSIFIITHHSDIDIPYDNEIVIVKNQEGVSSIV